MTELREVSQTATSVKTVIIIPTIGDSSEDEELGETDTSGRDVCHS